MTAVAFDTLRFARALREKAKLSPEQAEGLADAMVEVLDGNLATKADIREVRGDIEALRIQTRADIDALKLTTKADTGALRSEMIKWMFGTVGLQTIVSLGAVITLAPSLR